MYYLHKANRIGGAWQTVAHVRGGEREFAEFCKQRGFIRGWKSGDRLRSYCKRYRKNGCPCKLQMVLEDGNVMQRNEHNHDEGAEEKALTTESPKSQTKAKSMKVHSLNSAAGATDSCSSSSAVSENNKKQNKRTNSGKDSIATDGDQFHVDDQGNKWSFLAQKREVTETDEQFYARYGLNIRHRKKNGEVSLDCKRRKKAACPYRALHINDTIYGRLEHSHEIVTPNGGADSINAVIGHSQKAKTITANSADTPPFVDANGIEWYHQAQFGTLVDFMRHCTDELLLIHQDNNPAGQFRLTCTKEENCPYEGIFMERHAQGQLFCRTEHKHLPSLKLMDKSNAKSELGKIKWARTPPIGNKEMTGSERKGESVAASTNSSLSAKLTGPSSESETYTDTRGNVWTYLDTAPDGASLVRCIEKHRVSRRTDNALHTILSCTRRRSTCPYRVIFVKKTRSLYKRNEHDHKIDEAQMPKRRGLMNLLDNDYVVVDDKSRQMYKDGEMADMDVENKLAHSSASEASLMSDDQMTTKSLDSLANLESVTFGNEWTLLANVLNEEHLDEVCHQNGLILRLNFGNTLKYTCRSCKDCPYRGLFNREERALYHRGEHSHSQGAAETTGY